MPTSVVERCVRTRTHDCLNITIVPYELKVSTDGEAENKDGTEDVEVVGQDKKSKQAVARVLELFADQDSEWKHVQHEEDERPAQLRRPQQPEAQLVWKNPSWVLAIL